MLKCLPSKYTLPSAQQNVKSFKNTISLHIFKNVFLFESLFSWFLKRIYNGYTNYYENLWYDLSKTDEHEKKKEEDAKRC